MLYKICPRCGIRNSEESMFCNGCGEDLREVMVLSENKTISRNFKKIIIVSSSILAIILTIIITISLIIYFVNPVNKFEKCIQNQDSEQALEIYNDKIRGNLSKENKVNEYIKNKINTIEKDFLNEKLSYYDAKQELKLLSDLKLLNNENESLSTKINIINDSRIAFQSAKDFIDKEDYINAIKELYNVSSEDKDNYDKAKSLLDENKDKYKEQVLAEADNLINQSQYQDAIDKLNEAKNILSSDYEIQNKATECNTKLQQKQQADKAQARENAKNSQKVSVENVTIIAQSDKYKILYPDLIQATIKNNSDKTIKDFSIGFIAWDSNGYPIKIKGQIDLSGGSYVFIGKSDVANILAGATYGNGKGWGLNENHNISTIYGCVKTVTFYDGTTWNNPYYDYWVSDYSEKPLQK